MILWPSMYGTGANQRLLVAKATTEPQTEARLRVGPSDHWVPSDRHMPAEAQTCEAAWRAAVEATSLRSRCSPPPPRKAEYICVWAVMSLIVT